MKTTVKYILTETGEKRTVKAGEYFLNHNKIQYCYDYDKEVFLNRKILKLEVKKPKRKAVKESKHYVVIEPEDWFNSGKAVKK